MNGEITWLKGKSSFKACAAIIEKKINRSPTLLGMFVLTQRDGDGDFLLAAPVNYVVQLSSVAACKIHSKLILYHLLDITEGYIPKKTVMF